MHRVLQIPEVFLNIFSHLVPFGPSVEPRKDIDRDLAALARTCRAFKEPALDILWSELNGPGPLIRCLPLVASRKWCHVPVESPRTSSTRPSRRRKQIARKSVPFRLSCRYLSTRPLERNEWDILRSYARRVWQLRDIDGELDWKFVTRTSVDPTPAKLLFPNLRSLHCKFTEEIIPLLHLPFPSLIRLHIHLVSDQDLWMLEDPLKSIVRTSSNLKRLNIFCDNHSKFNKDPEDIVIISNGICGWSNLQSVTCPQIPLDMDALVHLSRMPSLAQLTFMLSDVLLDSTAPSDPFSFAALNRLGLHAESLALISKLFPWIRVPAITHFTVVIDHCPSKQDLTLFMANIQMVGMDQTIQEFDLNQVLYDNAESRVPLLDLDDLWSCMTFHHLRHMNLDLEWDVNLSDDELLVLGSAWPWLEELLINTNWGWNRLGITPNGFALLLETCPSLTSIALAIDTQGLTKVPATQFREPSSPSSFKRPFRLNVLDSVIESGSVNAVAAFFARIVPHVDFTLTAWEACRVSDYRNLNLYRKRWGDVHSQASEVIKKRWLNILCGLFFQS